MNNEHHKKARVRNRPRHKSNRLKTDATEDGKEVLPPGLYEQVAKTDICQTTNAVQIIQHTMRAKFLKHNKTMNDTRHVVESKDFKSPSKNKDKMEGIVKAAKEITLLETVSSLKSPGIKPKLDKKQAFMEMLMATGSKQLPNGILGNLSKLLNQGVISDVETSEDEEEYIEYIYKPRQYFLTSLCNACKKDIIASELKIDCARCQMTFYCSPDHMKNDKEHRPLCHGIQQVSEMNGGHIFHKSHLFSSEQFRCYRIVTIRKLESIIHRALTSTEKEVILFPRLCYEQTCREYRTEKLEDCSKCGQVSYCKENPLHLGKLHGSWCEAYQLFSRLVTFQEKFGRLDPSLPTKVLKDIPTTCRNTKQILHNLGLDISDPCEYAALTQISTGPLTAWYALKICNRLSESSCLTIHLIGAEIDFEADVLQKWEFFFMHLTPTLKELNVVFVGPELNPRNISLEQLRRTKCCRACRKNSRSVNYYFESKLYHEYRNLKCFLKPDLICFFNAGLYRYTGFKMEDTWPQTILAAVNAKCPFVVTSYTQHEAPLDMVRVAQESNRRFNVVLPPTINSFASEKPERNVISDEDCPFMYKNMVVFVAE